MGFNDIVSLPWTDPLIGGVIVAFIFLLLDRYLKQKKTIVFLVLVPLVIIFFVVANLLIKPKSNSKDSDAAIINYTTMVFKSFESANKEIGDRYREEMIKFKNDLKSVENAVAKNIMYNYSKSVEYYDQEKYDKALNAVDSAINLGPDQVFLHIFRSAIYIRMNDFGKSIEDLSFAIERGAGESAETIAKIYYSRGANLFVVKKYQQAINDLTMAISLDSKDSRFYYVRGWAYLFTNKIELMCKDYGKACDLGNCEEMEEAKGRDLCH